jgi:multidrug resistance protein MdtO
MLPPLTGLRSAESRWEWLILLARISVSKYGQPLWSSVGINMATFAQSVPESPRPWAWFREFVREELAPYPGRGALVARIVIASTLAMIVTMTFRVPYGAYAALYTLQISRESPHSTVKAVKQILIAFALSALYVLIGAKFFLDDPAQRLLWVIGSLFLTFYALSAMTNYSAAARFGYLVVITIPLWDRHIPAELRVEQTLWAVGAITLGSVITVLVELVFAELRPEDELVQHIAIRLAGVEELLGCYVAGHPVDEKTKKEITRQAMVGTSLLRRILRRSGYSPHYREQMGAVAALVGRLVDIAANLIVLNIDVSGDDRRRISRLAGNIASIRADLAGSRVPHLAEEDRDISASLPLLREMETTVSMIVGVFTGSQSLGAYAPPPAGGDSPLRLFVPDALSNSEHIKFGLRGCLAASLCYIIYSSVDWPEISTSITTCLLTALTTIGASRQKQVLRFAGTLAGGAVGLGAQVFILPHLDSITGFTVLFLVVTIATAWIATSSPRLSYFGIQVATAFYLINLQEFKFQTSLEVARDRVIGLMLGLVMMWLAFDQLWAMPAAVQMKSAFIANLRLLAQFAREPLSKDRRVAIERTYSLRETINKTFDKVRASADGVLFEFGPSRQPGLALRDRIRSWQPQLRMIFVTRIALLKYRLQLPGFELPEAVRVAQQEFDNRLAETLDGMAGRIEGNAPGAKENLEDSLDRLEQTIRTCGSEDPQGMLAARLQTFLPLSRRIEDLTISLSKEI